MGSSTHPDLCDVCIVGAGAAGLTAAIFAATYGVNPQRKRPRIVLLEGAPRVGAKILVSGGGRCNVTHREVSERDYWGGPRTIIRNVLRSFPVEQTLRWMQELGVELVLEPTGKYFPKSGQAREVLEALLRRVAALGVDLRTNWRVQRIERRADGWFVVQRRGDASKIYAQRLVLATGGMALPKSGSDGAGYEWARVFGHTIHKPLPALVPLMLERGADIGGRFEEFSGLSVDARLVLRDDSGKALAETQGPVLFTHFGISGPATLDLSRHVVAYRDRTGSKTALVELGHRDLPTLESAIAMLQAAARESPKRSLGHVLAGLYPERFARALTGELGQRPVSQLTRDERRRVAQTLTALPLRVIGDRGFSFAETTAGGVDLREIDWRTMESRMVPGLHFCGEILDVDGRIGGFNFQWAWASGFLAGRGVVA
ncbi:MAG: NAD(P)/FAD-dependent oxidoreductase [Candidatus Sumerlaea chitinivorans]|nr:NAD(P)/FAD-dependent oxidoreductase [Candidatus Sumerlaea chitinivorans]